jgi:putative phage-type endonuclease
MHIAKIKDLDDIYDSFDSVLDTPIGTLVSGEEKVSLYESMYEMIYEYMSNHIMTIKAMNFDEQLKYYVVENMELIIKEITTQENGEELISIIKEVYSYARKAYFAQFMPPRSYPTTFIRRAPNHEIMKVQIEFLRNKPQPEQRTDEWYKFRYNLLTASSIWKTFSSPNSQNQLIYEKCTPLNVDKYHSVNTESAMHHGQKYEDLSLMYYEKIYNTKVEDFGCIKHDDYYYIGASPDGINVDPSSSRYGRMLEIKNIVNREITGIPKEEYWIQMQVQMETCNMNECDFLETQFSEYESEEDFLSDNTDKLKGLLLYFMENGKPLYKYMPLEYTLHDDMTVWENKMIDEHSHLTWVKTIYWKLDKVSCVLVLRNKKWFECAQPLIKELWNSVEKERIEGYEHRAPKRNQRKRASSFVNIDTEQAGCLLDPNLFDNNPIIINTDENIVVEKSSGEIFTDLSFNTNILG